MTKMMEGEKLIKEYKCDTTLAKWCNHFTRLDGITRTGHCRLHYILLQVNTIFISPKSTDPAIKHCNECIRSAIFGSSVPPSFFAVDSGAPRHRTQGNTIFGAGLPFYDHFHL